jgi:diguanylate cyclase (GGDEF)-like protein
MNAQPRQRVEAVAQAADLSVCDREPIHIPGAIQPHGALLAVRDTSLRISHASANLADILGRAAQGVLGLPAEEVLGSRIGRILRGIGPRVGEAISQVFTLQRHDGALLHAHAHRSGRHICIDIEPRRPDDVEELPLSMLKAVLETFHHAADAQDLCELAVRGLKMVSGYDRIMAYRFDKDGHGEVIAEAREAGLERYLGLHYPAADLPQPARTLFLRQRVSTTADFDYEPVPLLAAPDLDDGAPLDLSQSALRSVSPMHRLYMKNMGTAASLTVALVSERALWGLLVCHHGVPRIAGPELRAVADMIGQVVSLMLRSLGEASAFGLRLERNATMLALVERLAAPFPMQDLASVEDSLLGVVDASGALVRMAGRLLTLGRTPPPLAAERALATLWAAAEGQMMAVNDLGLRYSELSDCIAEGSGALLLPLGRGSDDAILWFRPEQARTVTWGGNPSQHVAIDPRSGALSPRASFAAWKQVVRGQAAPWKESDLGLAQALEALVENAVALRTKSELATLRHYDSLTGLPNRSLLQERLGAAEREEETGLALLFLDLDRFKAINDSMGHEAGDALLIEAARRLRVLAGSQHLAARLGGDEFVVLGRGLDLAGATRLGERIRAAIEAPFEIADRQCHISCSFGIVMVDQAGGIDLIRAADMAMYAAKKGGGNRGVVFEAALFDHATQQFELEQDMRAALESGEQFVLLYQPIYRLAGAARSLCGFEALVRWRHPRKGWMSPGLFIPLAEQSGLIVPLGEWVLRAALRHAEQLRQARPGLALQIAVNVSPLQLAGTAFRDCLTHALANGKVRPDSLCLEVTESILTDAAATALLAEIRALGVRVAIDDFGIGYSSLSYLRRLPVDVVKLDRSFLEDVEGDQRGEGFVSAVVALAHAAAKPVVFEGIETKAQLEIASGTGADMVQGFFFAPPLSENASRDLVNQAATAAMT